MKPEDQAVAGVTAQKHGHRAIQRDPDTGLYQLWWLPQGENFSEGEAITLAGWYDIPSLEDVEEQCFDQAFTPSEDAVEADHPDSWPRLLGFI